MPSVTVVLSVVKQARKLRRKRPCGSQRGKIQFIGKKNGYGNVVVVRHSGQNETLYAHLSRFKPGLTVGSKVRQGQIIAFVGSTGLATAPHLHYEFLVNGIHKNPITVTLPRAVPLNAQALVQFRRETAPLVAKIDALSNSSVAALSTK